MDVQPRIRRVQSHDHVRVGEGVERPMPVGWSVITTTTWTPRCAALANAAVTTGYAISSFSTSSVEVAESISAGNAAADCCGLHTSPASRRGRDRTVPEVGVERALDRGDIGGLAVEHGEVAGRRRSSASSG